MQATDDFSLFSCIDPKKSFSTSSAKEKTLPQTEKSIDLSHIQLTIPLAFFKIPFHTKLSLVLYYIRPNLLNWVSLHNFNHSLQTIYLTRNYRLK